MMNELIDIIAIAVKVFAKFFPEKGITIKKVSKKIKIKNSDLPKIADFVNTNCQRVYFKPDIIFIPSAEHYQLAKSISSKFNNTVILNGILIKRERNQNNIPEILKNEEHIFDTDTWHSILPKALFENKNNKILFIDDWTINGYLLDAMKTYLKKKHIPETNFKSFCIATTKLAIQDKLTPDFYWKEISPDGDLYLPWGKAER
jgi:hypothetical protein